MDGTLIADETPPPWLIRTCCWLWPRLHGWWSIVFSLVLNVFAGLFLYPISPFSELTQLWAYQYKIPLMIILPILFIFTLFVWLISQFKPTPSLSLRQRHYLRQMTIEHASLKASGIPGRFFPPSIKLEEVFISPQSINERTPAGIDYPLRAEEIPLWQRIFAQRKRRSPRELMERAVPGNQFGLTTSGTILAATILAQSCRAIRAWVRAH